VDQMRSCDSISMIRYATCDTSLSEYALERRDMRKRKDGEMMKRRGWTNVGFSDERTTQC
jgi:hypothetical protein